MENYIKNYAEVIQSLIDTFELKSLFILGEGEPDEHWAKFKIDRAFYNEVGTLIPKDKIQKQYLIFLNQSYNDKMSFHELFYDAKTHLNEGGFFLINENISPKQDVSRGTYNILDYHKFCIHELRNYTNIRYLNFWSSGLIHDVRITIIWLDRSKIPNITWESVEYISVHKLNSIYASTTDELIKAIINND